MMREEKNYLTYREREKKRKKERERERERQTWANVIKQIPQ
jgi:hypothetical protein